MVNLFMLFFLKSNKKECILLTIREATAKRILFLCSEKDITINKLSTICGIT